MTTTMLLPLALLAGGVLTALFSDAIIGFAILCITTLSLLVWIFLAVAASAIQGDTRRDD